MGYGWRGVCQLNYFKSSQSSKFSILDMNFKLLQLILTNAVSLVNGIPNDFLEQPNP